MQRTCLNERGMALGVALFAMVVMGALVAGAFFIGTMEQRVGENTRRSTQAFGISEGGALETVRGWTPQTINNKRFFPLDTVRLTTTLASGGSGYYGGSIYKLNKNLYLVDVTGTDRTAYGSFARTGARQRVGMLVRVKPIQFGIKAAVTTRGPTTVNGNVTVDGNMHTPPLWSNCDPAADSNKAGVRHPNLSQLSGGGGAEELGQPPMLQDATVADSTFDKFADVNYADLVARATIRLPAGNYQTKPSLRIDGTCNMADVLNWGDGINHAAPCGSYFPIVHIAGTATINNVQGQGILLVDGDLNVQGGWQWFGVIIVKGAFKASGGGATDTNIWGAVLASNVNMSNVSITGRVNIAYSKCAIVQATQNTGLVSTLRSRNWVQLY